MLWSYLSIWYDFNPNMILFLLHEFHVSQKMSKFAVALATKELL